MPGAHRNYDVRRCGGTTEVINQSTVFVNDLLWAVDGDPCKGHGGGGLCKPIYGALNVWVEDKLIIVAVGDTAYNADNLTHLPGEVDPTGHSTDTWIYDGGAGGG